MADRPNMTKREFKKLLAARLSDPATPTRYFVVLAKMFYGVDGKVVPMRDKAKPKATIHDLASRLEAEAAASKKRYQ